MKPGLCQELLQSSASGRRTASRPGDCTPPTKGKGTQRQRAPSTQPRGAREPKLSSRVHATVSTTHAQHSYEILSRRKRKAELGDILILKLGDPENRERMLEPFLQLTGRGRHFSQVKVGPRPHCSES